ncbi:MAG: NAD(+)/NADH kinase [Fimbriiglobus sp.]|jgi:NAD kinase|nr:NAD(+)/NADH kinase [Fimbriiglobus sp.]
MPSTLRLPHRRVRLYFDRDKHEAGKLAEALRPFVAEPAEAVVVIGGDGTMLRAIRHHWTDGLPFFGLNTGHLGFLLNDPTDDHFWERDLRRYRLPLMDVQTICPRQKVKREVAFNDCWVERETGQTAWIEVCVNGVVRMEKVVADGMLIATAAGSTSYARAMGATPLPFNAPLLTLAASNVLLPAFWRPAVLPIDTVIRLRNLDPVKRPWRCFIDGIAQGPVAEMTARASDTAAVELLFAPEYDPVAKLAVTQFPEK